MSVAMHAAFEYGVWEKSAVKWFELSHDCIIFDSFVLHYDIHLSVLINYVITKITLNYILRCRLSTCLA